MKEAIMAKCSWCQKEMMETATCEGNKVVDFPDGTKIDSIPYGGEGRCPDCNVESNGFHHPGCDNEECPKCQGQLISCGCLDDEDENI